MYIVPNHNNRPYKTWAIKTPYEQAFGDCGKKKLHFNRLMEGQGYLLQLGEGRGDEGQDNRHTEEESWVEESSTSY